jgi:hypothetical protein
MPNTPNLHDWRPSSASAKDVMSTSLLDTEAHETVDFNESNVVGKDTVSETPNFGTLGAQGRN